MNEEELMKMVVRLVGDTASYEAMFQKAQEEAEKLTQVTKDLTRAERLKDEALAQGAAVTRSVEKASERYSREMRELSSLLKNGEITQETYNRATKKTTQEILQSSSAYTVAVSSANRYQNNIRELTSLAKAGALSQKELAQQVKLAGKEYRRAGNAATEYGGRMKSIGMGMSLAVTAPVAAIGAAAIKMGSDVEDAFIGVQKTVDETPQALEGLKKEFENVIKGGAPFKLTDLLGTAETAGQLGIDFENIVDFTKTVESLKLSTNLADEAGESLARIANISGLPQTEFENLGSTIVALGNNSATTEKDIVAMMLRLSGAGKNVGLTVPQIAGLSAALSSVGIEAEAGGTAFSQLFINLSKAIATGSKELEFFAQAAGSNVKDFSDLFRKDAAAAIQQMLEGLGSKEGDEALLLLENMGVEGARMTDAILRTAGAGDILKSSLDLAGTAFEENTALAREAQLRYGTFSGAMKNLSGQLQIAGAAIFKTLKPALTVIINTVAAVVKWVGELNSFWRTAIVIAAGVAAAIGPILIVLGSLLIVGGNVATLYTTLAAGSAALGIASGGATLGLAGLAASLKAVAISAAAAIAPWALIGGGLVLLGTKIAELLGEWKKLDDQLEKSTSLNTKLIQRQQNKYRDLIKTVEGLKTPSTQKAALATGLEEAKTTLEGYRKGVVAAAKEVKSLAWSPNIGARKAALAELEEARTRFRAMKAIVNDLQNDVDNFDASKFAQAVPDVEAQATATADPVKVPVEPEVIASLEKFNSSLESQINTLGLTGKEAQLYEIRVQMAGKAVDEATMKELKMAEAMIESLEAGEKKLKVDQEVKSTTESIQRQIDVIGMTQGEITLFDLKNLGASQDAINNVSKLLTDLEAKQATEKQAKQSKAEADKLTEKFLPPKEKLERRKKELQSLLDEGLISRDTFGKALEEAEETFNEIEKKTDKEYNVKLGVKGIDAVEAGSAEALARVMEFVDAGTSPVDLATSTSEVIPPASQEGFGFFTDVPDQQSEIAATFGLSESEIGAKIRAEGIENPSEVLARVDDSTRRGSEATRDVTLERIASGIELLIEVTKESSIELEAAELGS